MYKRFFPTLILLLPAGIAAAQSPNASMQSTQVSAASGQSGNAGLMKINDFTSNTAMINRSSTILRGSPYADRRWLPAHLVMTSNVQLPRVPLKYDVLNQRLLMRSLERASDSLQLDDRLLASFELEEPATNSTPAHRRTFRRFLEAPLPTQRPEFVEVLHEGKYKLLKRYVKTLRKAAPQNGFDSGSATDEVMDKTVYYMSLPDASVVQVKLTLKSLQSAAPALGTALLLVPGAALAKTDAEWATVFDQADRK